MASGDLHWYQHLGRSDGQDTWANGGQPIPVGGTIDWRRYRQVLAADDGVLYGLDAAGALYWHQHLQRSDPNSVTAPWANDGKPIRVGKTIHWEKYQQVFAADDGVIYGVDAARDLYWHQHLDHSAAAHTGIDKWANDGKPRPVGTALWRQEDADKKPNDWIYKQIFAADDGVIYGVQGPDPKVNGRLYWYRHLGRGTGGKMPEDWLEPLPGVQSVHIGSAWNYDQVFAADDDVIYGVLRSGTKGVLHWYRHLGRSDGFESWLNNAQITPIGGGIDWSQYRQVLAAQDAVIYALT